MIENKINLFSICEEGDIEKLKSHLNSISSSEIMLIRDENKATLLHYACRYGYLNILKYFLEEKHIDIKQIRTDHGATCAHDAAVCNQTNILKYLFHFNQNNNSENLRWNIRDERGNTPLHLAARYNCLNVLNYLLDEEYADPHNQSYNGFQAIHYACENNHYQSIKILLLKSPDTINEQTNQLLTPIHLACQNGSLEIIKYLILHGANYQLKDQNGLNSLHIACQYSHLNIIQWFIEKQNASINHYDYNNSTLIHYAAAAGNQHIINYLIEKNAKIISNNYGNTPLHLAAENGHQGVCAILIERGCCSLTSRNNQQLTPIDLAEKFGYLSLANELRLHEKSSSLIKLEKASIVRLVIKKRNVQRCDASNQVNEKDFIIKNNSNDILNQQNLQSFQQQIQNIQLNLRKVRRNSLENTEEDLFKIKQDISTTTSNGEYSNHRNNINGFLPGKLQF